jgi:hypothetical protein
MIAPWRDSASVIKEIDHWNKVGISSQDTE